MRKHVQNKYFVYFRPSILSENIHPNAKMIFKAFWIRGMNKWSEAIL